MSRVGNKAAPDERFRELNRPVIADLIRQLRSPLGVVPFVGAGMSAPFKFPQWPDFLRGLAAQLPRKQRDAALASVERKEFEIAADLVAAALGPEQFQRSITASFNDRQFDDSTFRRPPLSLVPLLTSGPIITTNFDRVLERAFGAAGRPFPDWAYGDNADKVVPAIQQNRLLLWKIHGDVEDRRVRVFSGEEYRTHYANLRRLLRLALTNRPALFLGSSLEQDRTVRVLEQIQRQFKAVAHFAIMPAPRGEAKFERRAQDMRRCGVRAIWYPEGRYEHIEQRLNELVQGMASEQLPPQVAVKDGAARVPVRRKARPAAAGREMLERELGQLSDLGRMRPPAGTPVEPPYVAIVNRLRRGELAFFLGAYACLGRLPLANDFYRHLAERFDGDHLQMEDPVIAQLFADKYGRDALYAEVDDVLRAETPRPTCVHWFVATLRSRLREKNYAAPGPWVFTTNYDDWMERALGECGERFHHFTYRVEDPYRGLFVYRDPDGNSRVADRPAHFRRLDEDCPVVVKFHGGLEPGGHLPVTYAFTRRDEIELAGRIPGAVPEVVLDALRRMPLLFLGHGLRSDSVEALVRETRPARLGEPSWAIQHLPREEKRVYWKQLGVDIVPATLEAFIPELHAHVDALRPRAGA